MFNRIMMLHFFIEMSNARDGTLVFKKLNCQIKFIYITSSHTLHVNETFFFFFGVVLFFLIGTWDSFIYREHGVVFFFFFF